MNEEFRASIDREVMKWPGVSKETAEGGHTRSGFWVPPATVYRFGRRHLGHVHHDDEGLADFSFPSEVRAELVRTGRAIPHPAFPDSRTDASYQVRSAEDVPGAVDLFRINYERVKDLVQRREAHQRKDAS